MKRREVLWCDVVKFTFTSGVNEVSGVSETHTIKVIEIDERDKEVELEIASNPIKVRLKVGEEAKIDLNNDSWYDLLVRFDKIVSGKAVITSKVISEKISSENIAGNETVLISPIQEAEEKPEIKINYNLIITIALVVLIATLVTVLIILSVRRIVRIHKMMNFKKKIGKKVKKR